MTNMELAIKPIIFRASYRDINLIMAIVNRALELYGKSALTSQEGSATTKSKQTSNVTSNYSGSKAAVSQLQPVGQARVLMSKEQVSSLGLTSCTIIAHKFLLQLKGSFDGFRFVLIGDLHEQPMLHLRVKPFVIGAKDWSGEVCF